MSRLRAATSIFFGVQEVCKGKPDTYKPMREAVAGVRAGRYVSTQGNAGNDVRPRRQPASARSWRTARVSPARSGSPSRESERRNAVKRRSAAPRSAR